MNFIHNLQPPDYNDVFTKLQDYILTDQTMKKAIRFAPEASSNKKKTKYADSSRNRDKADRRNFRAA